MKRGGGCTRQGVHACGRGCAHVAWPTARCCFPLALPAPCCRSVRGLHTVHTLQRQGAHKEMSAERGSTSGSAGDITAAGRAKQRRVGRACNSQRSAAQQRPADKGGEVRRGEERGVPVLLHAPGSAGHLAVLTKERTQISQPLARSTASKTYRPQGRGQWAGLGWGCGQQAAAHPAGSACSARGTRRTARATRQRGVARGAGALGSAARATRFH